MCCLDPSDVDVLVLAGDVGEVRNGLLEDALKAFSSLYPNVVFVPGNHEYYGASLLECDQAFRTLDESIPNLHILRRNVVELLGQRFIGTSLWFTEKVDDQQAELEKRLNDFHQISGGFRDWVYEEAARDAAFLNDTVRDGDVVVTHHIPSPRGVAERWQARIEGFGRFFVHALPEELIERSRLWCHGHGHDSVRTQVGNHTLVANPFGYLGAAENPDFDPKLVFEIY